MAQTALINEDIEAGKWLVDALRNAGAPVRAVFWLYNSNEVRWRLVVEASSGAGLDPWELTGTLHDAVAKIEDPEKRTAANDLLFGPISISATPHPIAELLRSPLGGAKSVFRTRIRNTMVGNYYIEDAVLYHLESDQKSEE